MTTRQQCDCDPVGYPEIADRLGTTRKTLETWVHRGQFPEPRWTVGGRPAWNWPDVLAELTANGRLVDGKVRGAGRPKTPPA